MMFKDLILMLSKTHESQNLEFVARWLLIMYVTLPRGEI